MLTVAGHNIETPYDTYQGRVIIRRRTFTVLNRNPNQGYRRITLEPPFAPRVNGPYGESGVSKASYSTFPNSLLFNFFKQSCLILIFETMSNLQSEKFDIEIDAAQFVYVESCYKILTSKYKKSKCNINISNISDLPFDAMCLSIEKDVDDTVPNEPTINSFLETTCG